MYYFNKNKLDNFNRLKNSIAQTIIDLFQTQVAKNLENIAVVFGKTKLTNAELNEKANQLVYIISDKYLVNTGEVTKYIRLSYLVF